MSETQIKLYIDQQKLEQLFKNIIPQDSEGKIEVVLGKPEEITYKPAITIPHGETKDIWTINPDKRLHLYGFIISTDTAGKVEIYIDTELFHPFIFNDKKSVPLPLPFEFWLKTKTINTWGVKAKAGLPKRPLNTGTAKNSLDWRWGGKTWRKDRMEKFVDET